MSALVLLVVVALVFALIWFSLGRRMDETGGTLDTRDAPVDQRGEAPAEQLLRSSALTHEMAEEFAWDTFENLHEEIPLPHLYGQDTVVALVRNPYSLYIYWERSDRGDENIRSVLGEQWNHSRPVLRIFDVTTGPSSVPCFEIEVGEHDDHWFVNERILPGHRYVASYERLLPDGSYHMLSHSAFVQVPHDTPSKQGLLYAQYGQQANTWSDSARR